MEFFLWRVRDCAGNSPPGLMWGGTWWPSSQSHTTKLFWSHPSMAAASPTKLGSGIQMWIDNLQRKTPNPQVTYSTEPLHVTEAWSLTLLLVPQRSPRTEGSPLPTADSATSYFRATQPLPKKFAKLEGNILNVIYHLLFLTDLWPLNHKISGVSHSHLEKSSTCQFCSVLHIQALEISVLKTQYTAWSSCFPSKAIWTSWVAQF